MIRGIITNTRQSLDIILESLDCGLIDIETGAVKVSSDPFVQSILSGPDDPGYRKDFSQIELEQVLHDKSLSIRNVIDGIIIYTLDGYPVGSYFLTTNLFNSNNRLNSGQIKKILNSPDKSLWSGPVDQAPSAEKTSASGPRLFRVVRQGNIGEVVGIAEIRMNNRIFTRLYSHLDYGKTGRFFAVNSSGQLISSVTQDYGLYYDFLRKRFSQLLSDSTFQGRVATFGREEFIIISDQLERLDWLIIGMVPLHELMDYSRRMTITIYLIGIACIILELFFSIWISQAISKPLKKLSDSMMDAADGDLQIRVDVTSTDEIGKLSHNFNDMIERISLLMDQVYTGQMKQRELELLALQSQINPHFLYNSLESLCALSQLERHSDAYRLGKSLSLFYRGVLSKGQPVITIEEEIRTIRNYFHIQSYRYMDKFLYSLDIDEDIAGMKIIKLSLQPIVENAIYHGLKEARRRGKILIRGQRAGENSIHISVVDNGIGIPRDKLSCLLSDSNPGTGEGGFGLSSVDQRIKLFFGEEYGLKIDSEAGFWTRVCIVLPYLPE